MLAFSDRLKEVLRKYTWLDFITSTIPFFETLCRHWYDKDHTIKFEEIMFDLLDLILLAVQLGGNFKKISENTLKHALHNALKENIQRTALKQFVLTQLVSAAPDAGKEMIRITGKEFALFLCPLQPSQESIFAMTEKVLQKVRETIAMANEAIRLESVRKKMLRQNWKVNVDEKKLEVQSTGISIERTAHTPNYYVIHNNDYFNVFWDKHNGEWRIINHLTPNEKKFCRPGRQRRLRKLDSQHKQFARQVRSVSRQS
ncbi:hypothetical protein ABK905_14510 [Acerihabitans sp. KWT182]|uniref:Uncharacterized protein n=1 Tax=Acerihabitans sp. KWT182 TaxID=3157919 RepID=A0AAU7Q6N8_9GAMM